MEHSNSFVIEEDFTRIFYDVRIQKHFNKKELNYRNTYEMYFLSNRISLT